MQMHKPDDHVLKFAAHNRHLVAVAALERDRLENGRVEDARSRLPRWKQTRVTVYVLLGYLGRQVSIVEHQTPVERLMAEFVQLAFNTSLGVELA